MATSASMVVGVGGKELGVISEASSPLKQYDGLRPLLGSKQMASRAVRKPNGSLPSVRCESFPPSLPFLFRISI